MKRTIWTAMVAVALVACGVVGSAEKQGTDANESGSGAPLLPDTLETATFAGGCFWCMEPPFEKLDGVTTVISGYAGGAEKNPTYHQVSSGRTGHTETVQIRFDPERISYGDLLEVFWRQIDPTDAGGQFVDRGRQYRPEIFVHDDAQRQIAERSRDALAASGRYQRPLATPITPYESFYEAEAYHQDFYKKSPDRYHSYRSGSGRDRYLDRIWGEDREFKPISLVRASWTRPSDGELQSRLTPLQYEVTQREGTEPAFRNEYWDNKEEGIYVDIVSGEPLFSSRDKFRSGTGWPSFTHPLVPENIARQTDMKLFLPRTEIRSKLAGSHLGHVFDDGPEPTGLRYCINSAALRFVPVADLEVEGYGRFLSRFEDPNATQ